MMEFAVTTIEGYERKDRMSGIGRITEAAQERSFSQGVYITWAQA